MWTVGWEEEEEEVQMDLKAMSEEAMETVSMRPPMSISIKYISCRRQGLCLGKWTNSMKTKCTLVIGKYIYGRLILKTNDTDRE